MNILSAALGRYESSGNPADADCIIAHSFGTSTQRGSVNSQLGDVLLAHFISQPVIADRTLVNALPEKGVVRRVVDGNRSTAMGEGVGSWGTLLAAQQVMEGKGLRRPLMIAQAHHIGRVVMQAKKLGITSIVPPHLPADFDPQSQQLWTRRLALWVPREVLGAVVLRAQDKL